MSGSFERIALITKQLLGQNRVLLVLLLLWPCLLSAIVWFASHGSPATDDVASILQQELFYGLVLVGLGASVALGTEQRARRIQQVLGRAIGRWEYLLALGAAAYLPFAGYVLVWLVNAGAFAAILHLHVPLLLATTGAELLAGLLLCAAGLLASVLLPQLLAAGVTGLLLAGCSAAGANGWGGIAGLFGLVLGRSSRLALPGAAESLGLSAFLLLLAVAAFARRDIKLG